MLAESIRRATRRSAFGTALVAFCVADAPRAQTVLGALGWRVLVKGVPLDISTIRGEFLRGRIPNAGCCGANELIKLYAFTLTEYHRVVHLDIDMLVLQPMDELFFASRGAALAARATAASVAAAADDGDASLAWPPAPRAERPHNGTYANGARPGAVDGAVGDHSLVYTVDYNMMNERQRAKRLAGAVQGGFLVVQPSLRVFEEIVEIVRDGRFGGKYSGWNNTGIGNWWGGATIQGVVPYYYAVVAPALAAAAASSSRAAGASGASSSVVAARRAFEVDRCVYDNMIDDPIAQPPPYVGAADCRAVPLADIKAVHFTLCQKPWGCRPARHPDDTQDLCVRLHKRWHDLRRAVERRLGLTEIQTNCVPLPRGTRGPPEYTPLNVSELLQRSPLRGLQGRGGPVRSL